MSRREELIAEEQFRLRSVLRLQIADVIDHMEEARVRSGLTPAQTRVAMMTTPGIPVEVLSFLAGHYSEKYESE